MLAWQHSDGGLNSSTIDWTSGVRAARTTWQCTEPPGEADGCRLMWQYIENTDPQLSSRCNHSRSPVCQGNLLLKVARIACLFFGRNFLDCRSCRLSKRGLSPGSFLFPCRIKENWSDALDEYGVCLIDFYMGLLKSLPKCHHCWFCVYS